MGISAGPSGVSDGLVFQLDAANLRSYSGSGNTANGLVSGIGGTLVNGVGFTSSNSGSFIFDGTDDYINISSLPANFWNNGSWTVETFLLNNNSSSGDYGVVLNPNKLHLSISNSLASWGVYNVKSTSGISTNSWTHIAYLYNSSDYSKQIYVNGALNNSGGSGFTSYDNPDATWVGCTTGIAITTAISDTTSAIGNSDIIITFSNASTGAQIGTTSQTFWSSSPFTALNQGDTTLYSGIGETIPLILSFSKAVSSFGVELETRDLIRIRDFTVKFYNGSTVVGTITRTIDNTGVFSAGWNPNNGGARLFAGSFDAGITGIAITTTSRNGIVAAGFRVGGIAGTYQTGSTEIGKVSSGNNYFNGKIAHLKFYNRLLSATEVMQNYNAMRERYNI
jgi:hypothetical protein